VDSTLQKALATVDDGKRAELLAQGSRTAMEDYAAIPLHFEMTTWAFKKNLDYVPRADQATQGQSVTKGK
jgi:peptide/nickel transport system substrate-binding protein